MGTVVSKRQSAEVSESTAVKIRCMCVCFAYVMVICNRLMLFRVVAAFQSNCKDNSSDKEGIMFCMKAIWNFSRECFFTACPSLHG